MVQWLYRRLLVFSREVTIAKHEGATWYLDYSGAEPGAVPALRGKLYAGGRRRTRLALNPMRNWGQLDPWELLGWDEDSGHADLLDEVLSRLGLESWELAGIHDQVSIYTSYYLVSYYLLKKPREAPA